MSIMVAKGQDDTSPKILGENDLEAILSKLVERIEKIEQKLNELGGEKIDAKSI